MKTCFITGTDTGVGKTYVSCEILKMANKAGFSTAAVKPLAAGGEMTGIGLCNEDALALQEVCSLPLGYQEINPVCLESAIAPHIAASIEGREIDLHELMDACRRVMDKGADLTLIEGAGGWRVPMNGNVLVSDLVKALEIPVIIVVGMRLGCLNHALLTAETVISDGLPLQGWVANQLDSGMPAYKENLETLAQLMPAPMLAEIRYLAHEGAHQDTGQAWIEKLLDPGE